jgi:ribonuclease BN (tRNA processing enzyme)
VAVALDFGSGALAHLLDFTGMDNVDAIVLSHLHADHVSDMRILAYMLNPLVASGRRMKLPVYLPAGPKPDFDEIANQPAFAAVTVDPDKPLVLGDCMFAFFKTIHAVPCHAMRIEADGAALVYSADSVFDTNLAAFARYADVLLCDAAFDNGNKPKGAPHMSGEEAAKLAKLAGVRRLYLTHLHPQTDESALIAQAQTVFPGAQTVREHETIEVGIGQAL